jgi:hypothetical protein
MSQLKPRDSGRPAPGSDLLTTRLRQAILICAAGAFAVALLVLLRRIRFGLHAAYFVDEAVPILAARVLLSGGRLYQDFVDNHGPLIFGLVQGFTAVMGSAEPNRLRVIPALFGIVCIACVVAGTPRSLAARLVGGAAFCGLLAAAWLPQAMYFLNFYAPGGVLASLILAVFVVPAWRRQATARRGFISGIASAALFADAYAYGPACLLFLLSGSLACIRHEQRRAIAWHLAGAGVGAALLLIYLALWGSVLGYLAFHIVESQFFYAPYIGFSWNHFFASLAPAWQPGTTASSLAVLYCLGGTLLFAARACWASRHSHSIGLRLCEILLAACAVLSLNMRGSPSFRDASLAIAAITFLALALGEIAATCSTRQLSAIVALTVLLDLASEMVMRGAIYSPFNLTRTAFLKVIWPLPGPLDAPFIRRIQAGVQPQEKILALVYQPQLYINADRLPISGFYAYFPWNADYAAAPVFGLKADICATLKASEPPLIAYDDSFRPFRDPHDYAACVFSLIGRDYVRDPIFPQYFWRRDRATKQGFPPAPPSKPP